MFLIAGKYEVIREIGSGSTGTVYLVRHVDIGVEYALKLLSRALSADDRFIERFKREAGVLESFTHPGSIKLRDFGKTEDGRYYMTMDYCDGVSLNDLLASQGNFNAFDTLEFMIQMLEVLEAAHSSGIIHRDIKPENVMVEIDGEGNKLVKILDFGIAKLRERMELKSSVSVEGISIGTPQYMSPEQAAGEPVLDNRVDIYSAGILMYELLAGEVPFQGETIIQTLLMHIMHPAPSFEPALKVPIFIEEIVQKALAKQVEQRFKSAQDFKEACEAALQKVRATDSAGLIEPVVAESNGEPEVEASHEQEGASADTKILCLDDNPMILDILSHILEKEGYTVFTATDSLTIHNYLFQEDVELLITDVKMPGMRGTKVCEMLKQSMKRLKIVLFSNLPERDLERLSIECDADAWISKNRKPDEWLHRIREVLV